MLKSSSLRNNPWVQAPLCKDVEYELHKLKPNYYRRGSGEATQELELAISKHREWVSPIVDLKKTRKKASDILWNLKKNPEVRKESNRILLKHTLSDRNILLTDKIKE